MQQIINILQEYWIGILAMGFAWVPILLAIHLGRLGLRRLYYWRIESRFELSVLNTKVKGVREAIAADETVPRANAAATLTELNKTLRSIDLQLSRRSHLDQWLGKWYMNVGRRQILVERVRPLELATWMIDATSMDPRVSARGLTTFVGCGLADRDEVLHLLLWQLGHGASKVEALHHLPLFIQSRGEKERALRKVNAISGNRSAVETTVRRLESLELAPA